MAVDETAVQWEVIDRFLEAFMIASESTAFTLDRTERFCFNALQEALDLDRPAQTMPDRGATLMSSSFGRSVPMLPIDCTTLISIQRIQKKESTAPHDHVTHN